MMAGKLCAVPSGAALVLSVAALVGTTSQVNAACDAAPSDRLTLRCSLDLAERERLRPFERVIYGNALWREGYLERNDAGARRSLSVAPVLRYSENINGGNPDGVLRLGNLEFTGDPELERKPGLLAGGRVGFEARHVFDDGRYLDFDLGASAQYSPRYDRWVTSGYSAICSKNHVGNWWFVDGCYQASYKKRELTEDFEQTASLSGSKVFMSGWGRFHEASLGLKTTFVEGEEETLVTGALETLHAAGFSSHLGLEVGIDAFEDRLSTDMRISAGVAGDLFDRRVSLRVNYEFLTGGKILGYSRSDEEWDISVGVEVREGLYATLGYSVSNSSIDYFDQMTPTASIRFAPIRF